MKLTKLSRRAVASTIGSMMTLATVLGLTACTRDYTVAYVYTTASNKGAAGVVNAYAVDYQTGALVRIGNPVPTGINPVSLVTAPNGVFLYVLNHDDSTVQVFGVNTDGSLSTKRTHTVRAHTYGALPAPCGDRCRGQVSLCDLYVPNGVFDGDAGARWSNDLPD